MNNDKTGTLNSSALKTWCIVHLVVKHKRMKMMIMVLMMMVIKDGERGKHTEGGP